MKQWKVTFVSRKGDKYTQIHMAETKKDAERWAKRTKTSFVELIIEEV